MNDDSLTHKIGTLLNLIYPCAIASILLCLKFYFNLDYKLLGFKNVLESTINFSAIIIGFYTAMYGVLITLKDSEIMKKFRKRQLSKILKFQLYDSLIASFMVLLTSVLMQVMINYSGNLTGTMTNVWFFITGYFISTSFRAISLLLNIMFHSESNESVEKDEEDDVAKIDRWNKLKPKDDNFK